MNFDVKLYVRHMPRILLQLHCAHVVALHGTALCLQEAKQQEEQRAAEEKAQAARVLAEEQRQAQEKMQEMQQQQLAQMKQLQQMQLMQKVNLHESVHLVRSLIDLCPLAGNSHGGVSAWTVAGEFRSHTWCVRK